MTNGKMLEQLKKIDEKLETIQSELDDGNNKDIGNILDDCFGFLRKARMELAKVEDKLLSDDKTFEDLLSFEELGEYSIPLKDITKW